MIVLLWMDMMQFQSTLPRGSDLSSPIPTALYIYFNPRSLAGATVQLHLIFGINTDFNPRSLAGATAMSFRLSAILSPFQSTLPRGSDQNPTLLLSTATISIHAPSRERR